MSQFSPTQWATLIVLSLAEFFNGLCISLQAPFYPYEAQIMGVTATQYSFVFGVFQLTVFLISPLIGQFMNHIGINFLNNIGIFTLSISCICFGFLNQMPTTALFLGFSFLIRIVEALGYAAFVTTTFSIIAQTFPDNVAFTFATLETFVGLGIIVGPAVGGALYDLGGFTLPFVALGTALCCGSIAVYCFLPNLGHTDRPTSEYSVFTLLKQPRILLAACTTTSSAICIGFLQATLEPHIRSWNLTPIEIGLLFVLNGATYAVSSPIFGRLCDKLLPERVVTMIGAVVVAISFLLVGPCPLLPLENTLSLCIFALSIHGIGVGAELIATFSGSQREAQLLGLPNDRSTFGLVSGLWASSFALGAFIGPSIAGVLFDTIGFAWGASIVAGLHIVIAVVTVLCSCGCTATKPILEMESDRSALLRSERDLSTIQVNGDSSYGSLEDSNDSIFGNMFVA